MTGAGTITAVLLAGALLACGGGDTSVPAPGPGSAPADVELGVVQTFPGELPRDHVEGDVDYPQTPPVGGAHASRWQTCGFYAEEVPEEQAVHSLEHGAVWIAYDPSLGADALDVLRDLAGEYVLVSPRQDLAAPVVASAWGLQLAVDDPDDPALAAFVDERASGPQTPEPGAPCTGGVGTPAA